MANLGDKEYNYNYYGLPISREWKNNADTDPFAALVKPNIWGYQPDGIYYDDGVYSNADKNGKPLDDTIAVWRLPNVASFACNAFFSLDVSSTLGAHYDVNVEDTNVPLLCAAIDTTSTNWGYFDRKCVERYAYDTVNTCNGPKSALAYDIKPNALCLHGFVITYDRATPGTAPAGRTLTALAAYIDNAPATREVTIIRPTMYRGTGATRISTPETIPEFNAPYFDGILLADTSSNIPIPAGQTYLKSLIADTAGGHNYRNDAIYRPFASAYFYNLYSGTNTNTYTYQLDIGFSRPFTKNQIINGAATISGANKITGQLYRCNYEPKYFDDVAYIWENVIFDTVSGVEIQNGFDVSSYADNRNIRFYTRIRIIDYKGNTKGKALELAVKHELAYIGFYFADTQARAESAVLGAAGDGVGVYLPEIIKGVTTGRYFTGDEIKDVPYADSNSVGDDVYHYDPDSNPGEDDIGDFHTHINSGAISAGTIYYAVSDTEFKDLIRYLNTTYNPDETQLAEDFKGVNPFDYITSAKYYPFPLPYAVAQAINVGPLATGVTGYIMPYTYGNSAYSYFEFGSYTFTPTFYNFLDYSATQIQLYLPWCGVVNLDPAVWIAPPGRTPITLRIRYSFDYVTGSVTAFIFRDGGQGEFLIDSADGTAGIDVPLSLFATGSYQQQIAQAQIAYKQAATSRFTSWMGVLGGLGAAAISGVMGNPLGVVGGLGATGTSLLKLHQSELSADAVSYTLDHTQPQLGAVSAASPFNAAIPDQRPFIIISRPRMQSTLPTGWQSSYARTVGYACTIPTSLSNPRVRGFTVIQSPRLEGIKKSIGTPPKTYTPTEQELGLIRQHMAAGIIL